MDFPAKEIQGREGCYPDDSAQDRMEIEEETRQILREALAALGLTSGAGSGSGYMQSTE